MKLLALDTSSLACTVALNVGDELFERHEEQAREHTRLLIPMIREVVEEAGVALTDLDSIVLGNGPGSFIGMRIAASVAQGLAHGAGLRIVPVSSLAAVAAEVFETTDAQEVAVAQDAHMGEVYLGLFGRGDAHLPSALGDERLQPQDAIAEFSKTGIVRRIAAGYGWQRYPELMNSNRSFFSEVSSVLYPRARYLLALAGGIKSVAPQDINPAYLRKKVAEKPRPSRQ